MRKIIDKKVFDTDKAEMVCGLTCTSYSSDFGWHDTDLYRTESGIWFLAGRGNAFSMWGKPAAGGKISGEGIRVLGDDEALEILEAEDQVSAIKMYFEVEEA